MKNRIDDGSSKNVHTSVFSLDKFIESDAPGTLSWLKMAENDLIGDIPPFRGVNLNSIVVTYTGVQQNKQDILYQLKCVWRRSQLIESPDRMGHRDKQGIPYRLKCVWSRNQQNESSYTTKFRDISNPKIKQTKKR